MKNTSHPLSSIVRKPQEQLPPRRERKPTLAVRTRLRAGKWSMSESCNNECVAACQDAGHDAGWCLAMRCEEWPAI